MPLCAFIHMRRDANADDVRMKWMHATAARCILSCGCICRQHKKQSTSPSSYWYVIAGGAPLAAGTAPGWFPSFLFPNGFFEYVFIGQGKTHKLRIIKRNMDKSQATYIHHPVNTFISQQIRYLYGIPEKKEISLCSTCKPFT